VRLIGLVWLGLTFGFLAAAYGVGRRKPWAVGLTGVLAIVSLIVCVAGLPETAVGVAIDVVILATVSYVAFYKARSLGPIGRSIS
jgi:peptidoglycan/LPS O-acetylase OafA/YrhL